MKTTWINVASTKIKRKSLFFNIISDPDLI